jgi:hypothetical protein
MIKANNAHTRALKASKVKAFRIYDLRHTWATRAAESRQVDMTTLAALLGHSKLNKVMRYAHPQEKHQADAVKRLDKVNAAREISETEKRLGTNLGTALENQGNFSGSKSEGNSSRIN